MSTGIRGVVIRDNLWWNFATSEGPQPYWQNANAQWVLSDAANSDIFVDPMLRSLSRTNVPAFRLDPRPQAGSPALSSPIILINAIGAANMFIRVQAQ